MATRLDTRATLPEDAFSDEALREICGAPFPAVPIVLVLALTVTAVVVAVGVRVGWALGAAAGVVAWGGVSGIVILCAGLAAGDQSDAAE
jgi:hypothetical protein